MKDALRPIDLQPGDGDRATEDKRGAGAEIVAIPKMEDEEQ